MDRFSCDSFGTQGSSTPLLVCLILSILDIHVRFFFDSSDRRVNLILAWSWMAADGGATNMDLQDRPFRFLSVYSGKLIPTLIVFDCRLLIFDFRFSTIFYSIAKIHIEISAR
jgi:hypothetical protein